MNERIRFTAAARNQLIALKRRTGIEHYNVLCRHALCISLATPSIPAGETYNFQGGMEMDFRVLTGGHEALYANLVLMRALKDGIEPDETSIRDYLIRHLHRGLAFLNSLKGDTPEFIAEALIATTAKAH
jgi:DNA sulfur modification protein DndE